ncbi:retropepsin-like aspartic protease [Flexithrix dorotheae]|uniref:retropepsin-like aspartic protease n=1 Tax=Flexithrix dorotheae TaxID=70993 RepID=UPI0003788036|nr:retropepsin-like aspartic protease [Flexithrix dorotheae]
MKLFLLAVCFISTLLIDKPEKKNSHFLISDTTSYNTVKETKILNKTGLPIIEGTLNGKKAYFLLDTGSSMSLLNSQDAKNYGFKLWSKNNISISGIGGRGASIWAVIKAEIKIGDKNIKGMSNALNISGIEQFLRKKTRYHISGIIGSDVMQKHGFVVDYTEGKCVIKK